MGLCICALCRQAGLGAAGKPLCGGQCYVETPSVYFLHRRALMSLGLGRRQCLTTLRSRVGGFRLKIEHGIIDGLRETLEKMLVLDADRGAINVIVPGTIAPIKATGHGKSVKIRVTIPIANGFKCIAVASGSRQEVFINTSMVEKELNKLIQEAIAAVGR